MIVWKPSSHFLLTRVEMNKQMELMALLGNTISRALISITVKTWLILLVPTSSFYYGPLAMSSTTQKRAGCEGCCRLCFHVSYIPLCLCTNYCGLPPKFPITSIMPLNRSPVLCSAISNHLLLAIEHTFFPQLLNLHHHRPWSELKALGLLVHDSLYNPRGLCIPIFRKKENYTPTIIPIPTSIFTIFFHLLSIVS